MYPRRRWRRTVEWYIYHRLSIGRVQGLEDPPGDFSRPPAGSGRPLSSSTTCVSFFRSRLSFRIVSHRIASHRVAWRGVASCRAVPSSLVSSLYESCCASRILFVLRKTSDRSCANAKRSGRSVVGDLGKPLIVGRRWFVLDDRWYAAVDPQLA